jgi:hypothetical protein
MSMRIWILVSLLLVATVTAGVLLALVGSPSGRSKGTASTTWTPSRTPDGQPDLQGVWTNGALGRPLEAPEHLDGTAALDSSRIPLIVEPADGKIPFQPWALERRNFLRAHFAKSLEFLDTRQRCLPPGVPRVFYPHTYIDGKSDGNLFLQSPGQVMMLFEWNHQYRIIPLDGRSHPGPGIHLWMGDSRGHWEKNTLIVDVTNFSDKTWLDEDAEFYGEALQALHVIEHFTIVDADTINYEATLENPKVFTRPWTVAIPLKRAEKDYELFEYACHEGNRALEFLPSLQKGRSQR